MTQQKIDELYALNNPLIKYWLDFIELDRIQDNWEFRCKQLNHDKRPYSFYAKELLDQMKRFGQPTRRYQPAISIWNQCDIKQRKEFIHEMTLIAKMKGDDMEL